ncbi:MAG: hypothetical protein LBM87_02510 [Ruminococcus sp.]|jgi:hypothetical protein|nr:hypothetical protein [Ruminococcus sp.]
MKYKTIMKLIASVLAAAMLLTACGDSKETVTTPDRGTTTAAQTTKAAETTAATVNDVEAEEVYVEIEETEPESEYPEFTESLEDFAGWYYRPEEREGIAVISILEIIEDGSWNSYDELGNVLMSGYSTYNEDDGTLVLDVEDFGEVPLYYNSGGLFDESDEVAFFIGEPLSPVDLSFIYGKWNMGVNQTDALYGEYITLNEDGTFERFHNFGSTTSTGTYELRAMKNMINGYGTETLLVIELTAEDSFSGNDYYVLPGEGAIYNSDSWGDRTVYVKPDLDGAEINRYLKLAALLDESFSNEDYQLTFYSNGIFSVDKITSDDFSTSYSYYCHGLYEINEDFTNFYIVLDDGSYEGECGLEMSTEGSSLFAEPFGLLKQR